MILPPESLRAAKNRCPFNPLFPTPKFSCQLCYPISWSHLKRWTSRGGGSFKSRRVPRQLAIGLLANGFVLLLCQLPITRQSTGRKRVATCSPPKCRPGNPLGQQWKRDQSIGLGALSGSCAETMGAQLSALNA